MFGPVRNTPKSRLAGVADAVNEPGTLDRWFGRGVRWRRRVRVGRASLAVNTRHIRGAGIAPVSLLRIVPVAAIPHQHLSSDSVVPSGGGAGEGLLRALAAAVRGRETARANLPDPRDGVSLGR